MSNNLKMIISSNIENIATVRVAVATFVSSLDLKLDDLVDIKTAVSEAVTNSVEHGYIDEIGEIHITVKIKEKNIDIIVEDFGIGIADIEMATSPTYTSKPELEHAGLGFTIMESFMDEIVIDTKENIGTKIIMRKEIK